MNALTRTMTHHLSLEVIAMFPGDSPVFPCSGLLFRQIFRFLVDFIADLYFSRPHLQGFTGAVGLRRTLRARQQTLTPLISTHSIERDNSRIVPDKRAS
jgi:hypothetical protein